MATAVASRRARACKRALPNPTGPGGSCLGVDSWLCETWGGGLTASEPDDFLEVGGSPLHGGCSVFPVPWFVDVRVLFEPVSRSMEGQPPKEPRGLPPSECLNAGVGGGRASMLLVGEVDRSAVLVRAVAGTEDALVDVVGR